MNPIQAVALERFLLTQGFQYPRYDPFSGVVTYITTVGDWIMEVAYGDDCYFRLYNNATGESYLERFLNLSQLMLAYSELGSD